ncbi:MAG: autotransporter domain-containing protein [Deltaproteobacteria bacterium]|nr:autotransporter domain-containing protein [Deltaproteobacteria bacterium]
MTMAKRDRRAGCDGSLGRTVHRAAGTLAGLALIALTTPLPVLAACQPADPIDGDLVTCTGDNLVGYTVPVGVNNIDLYIEAGATFTSSGDVMHVRNISIIRHNGTINANGVGSVALLGHVNTGINTSSGSTIVLNSPGSKGIEINVDPQDPTDPPFEYTNGAVNHAGTITGNADSNVGISVGAGTNVTSSGTISLYGEDSDGIRTFNAPGDSAGGGTITQSGRIELNGADSRGILAADHYDVTHDGTIALSANAATAIITGNDTTVTNTSNGSIEIDAASADSFGIYAGDDSTLINSGSIVSQGARSVGMRGGTKTNITNHADTTLTLEGNGSTAIDLGSAGVITNFGSITVSGTNSIGLYGQDGIDESNVNDRTRFSNEADAVILVNGDNSHGLLFGSAAAGSNKGLIEVKGNASVAAELGAGSQIVNFGTIYVSGTDSIGVIAGGNTNRTGLNHIVNAPGTGGGGILESLDPEAGPLIQLRPSTTNTSQVLNFVGAVIRADLTNVAQAGRGVAIQGSTGEDRIDNQGLIEGKIQLGAGPDLYVQSADGELTFIEDGQLDGGGQPGDIDQVILQFGTKPVGQLNVGVLQNFEEVHVESGFWRLEGTAISPADLIVEQFGTLVLSEPLYMDGSYSQAEPGLNETASAGIHALLRDNDPATPLMQVTGTADVDGREMVVAVGGGILGSRNYTVLQADGGLTGTFSDIILPTDAGLFFGTPVYDANSLTIPFAVTGYSNNQLSTNAYLQRVEDAGASTDLQAILDDLSSLAYSPYKAAMLQLHGEAYDAHASATLELANAMTLITLQRPRYCLSEPDQSNIDPQTGLPCRERRWEPWLTLLGHTGSRTGSDGHTSWENDAGGLLFGIDRRFGQRILVSGTLGTSHDGLNVADVGKGRFTTLDMALAGQWTRGPLLVQGLLGYGHSWHDQFRNIRIPNFARTAKGEYSLDRVSMRVHGEYAFEFGSFRLAPLASLDYTALIRSAVTETGAEWLNLVLDDHTDNIVTIRIGGELGYSFKKDAYWTKLLEATDGAWRPTLSLRWRQVVSGYQREISGRFLGAPLGAGSFTVAGNDARQGFEIGAGVDFTPRGLNRLTFGLGYEGFVWENVGSHSLTGRIRFSF